MAKHVLVINGNPDPGSERLTGALANAYAEAAEQAGHTARLINVGGIAFPVMTSAAEFVTEPDAPDIVAARSAMLLADHLVFIYPLWLGGPPALLKAFMEQVARREFLSSHGPGFPKPGLKGRSARFIVTMGMPVILFRVLFGARGAKAFMDGFFMFSGIRPRRVRYFGNILPGRRYPELIDRMRRLGKQAA